MAAPFPGSPIVLRDRAILELLYGTGLRLGEAARTEGTNLDLRSGLLLVRNGTGRKADCPRLWQCRGGTCSHLT